MFRLCLVLVLHINAFKAQSNVIGHSISFLYANRGDTVTLKCPCPDGISYVSWHKEISGQKPRRISTIFKYAVRATFHNEFKDNHRFSVPGGKGEYNLRISDIQPSDSGEYYCKGWRGRFIKFTFRISLILKVSVHPGDSVTLNCTINTGTCAGDHSVYWFRHDSGESHPGIIYTHGDRSGQCKNSTETGSPTQSCVYNLPKRNLSLSDAGTYYCAVVSCGEILFGNGTKLDIQGCKGNHLLLLYCLGTALGLCVILITVLTCVLYKINTSNGMRILNQLVQLSPVIVRIKRMTHSITLL
ncbi:hypothetical protein DPEC_G00104120 [Dallia pectoralis]|uniref:Uncharacterized protein n=1 Tax=Dallia pectoralis TaxID=75939 RepID=A0ACC2GXX5_DALPE|nr:hypothetical protein DPEC_G00104120 [Dallia pectoralis]